VILPLFHQLTESQQDLIVSLIRSALTGSVPTMSVR
jgi:hypothetical protein